MGSTGIKESLTPDTHPRPLPKGGESLPPTPSEGGGGQACEELVCTLFVLPSFGGVGGGSRILGGLPAGSLSWGGRTTYRHLIKLKIKIQFYD